MITTKTLVGLACLIANKGPIDTTSIEAQLNADEKIQVESLIQSGTCLPANMEDLLITTKEKIRKGELRDAASHTMPTDGCF